MSLPLPFADYQYPQPRALGPIIALVGEAPGADEIKLGRPFVGRAGQLLDRGLAAAGIDRGQCLIANVFRYRPPDNKIGHFFASRRKAVASGTPIDEALGKMGAEFCLACYSGELEALGAALNAVGADVVVALGRTPLWALTGMNGITAMRGRELPNRLGKAPVIATFHPSFVIRQNSIGPETEATFVADLRLAKSLAAGRAQAISTSPSSPGMGAPG
jgi:DNA polymerase